MEKMYREQFKISDLMGSWYAPDPNDEAKSLSDILADNGVTEESIKDTCNCITGVMMRKQSGRLAKAIMALISGQGGK